MLSSPNGLNCKQVSKLAQRIASMRDNDIGVDAVRGTIGGADNITR